MARLEQFGRPPIQSAAESFSRCGVRQMRYTIEVAFGSRTRTRIRSQPDVSGSNVAVSIVAGPAKVQSPRTETWRPALRKIAIFLSVPVPVFILTHLHLDPV